MAEPDSPELVYVFDSSSWISIEDDPARDRILHRLSQLIDAGRIRCPPEAWDELKKCDWVLAWIGHRRGEIVFSRRPLQYLRILGEIYLAFPGMCASRGSREKADGYVVAMAA